MRPVLPLSEGILFLTVKNEGNKVVRRAPVAFRRNQVLIDAVSGPAEMVFREEGLGKRLVSACGIESDWLHFFLKGPGGKKAVPYVEKGGKRIYLDMRNFRLDNRFNGMELEISVVSYNCDFQNSIAGRIDEIFAASDVLLQELEEANSRAARFSAQGLLGGSFLEPDYSLHHLLSRSRMNIRKLRDIYMRKLIGMPLRGVLPAFQDYSSGHGFLQEEEAALGARLPSEGDPEHQSVPAWPAVPLSLQQAHQGALRGYGAAPNSMLEASFQRLYYAAAGQRQEKRARLAELGQKAMPRDKEQLASLEADVKRREQQLESLLPLFVRNLESARFALECPAACS